MCAIDAATVKRSEDELIFLSAITRILRHFSVPFHVSDHFHVMCAIDDAATVKRSNAQLRLRWSGTAIPPASTAPSTSAPSSFMGGAALEDIMA